MGPLVVHFCLTNSPVTTLTLTALELRQGTVNSDKEDIEMGEEAQESIHPVRCFDNVLNDQIVAGLGQRWQATMETIEKGGSHFPPGKLPAVDTAFGKYMRGA
jgi:hypothetical protein